MNLVSVLVPGLPASDGPGELAPRRRREPAEPPVSQAAPRPTVEPPAVPTRARATAPVAAEVTESRVAFARPSAPLASFASSLTVTAAPDPSGMNECPLAAGPARRFPIGHGRPGAGNAPMEGSKRAPADAAGIRPMALAPTDPGTGHAFIANSGGSGGPSGGSKAPGLSSSGGSPTLTKQPDGRYTIPDGVPVGTVMTLVATPAYGYQIDVITWAGGTEIKDYLKGDPVSTPPKKQIVDTPVAKNQTIYSFIVDADARTYTVTANVTYKNGGGSGTSTLTFDSVRPTVANLTAEPGEQVAGISGVNQVGVGLNSGIDIWANVTAHPKHGSDFMFMHVLNTTRIDATFDVNGPQRFYVANSYVTDAGEDFNGPLHDDYDGEVAYPHEYDGDEGRAGWHTHPGGSMPVPGNPTPLPPLMEDEPGTSIPDTNVLKLSRADSFSTYLMYKPTNGAWVALKRTNWSWSQSIERASLAANWPNPHRTPQPEPSTSTPTGMAAFPTWVNLVSNFNILAINPWKPL